MSNRMTQNLYMTVEDIYNNDNVVKVSVFLGFIAITAVSLLFTTSVKGVDGPPAFLASVAIGIISVGLLLLITMVLSISIAYFFEPYSRFEFDEKEEFNKFIKQVELKIMNPVVIKRLLMNEGFEINRLDFLLMKRRQNSYLRKNFLNNVSADYEGIMKEMKKSISKEESGE